MGRPAKIKPTLVVDTREKTPWDFEGDDAFEAIEYRKLDGGDYSIKGMEHLVAIERKATMDELYNNFTKDKERITAEFERLKDHKFRIVIIEESCEDIMNPGKYYVNRKGINKFSPMMPVAVVISSLTKLMLEHKVHIIFGGARAQSVARGILLESYNLHTKDLL